VIKVDRITLIGFGTVGKSIFDTFIDGKNLSLEHIVVSRGYEGTVPKAFEDLNISWTEFVNLSPRKFVVCIGYQNLNLQREKVFTELKGNGHIPVSLLHEKAIISKSALIQPGAIVFGGVVLENDVKVGEGAILWSNCTIGHESSVGAFSFVAANVSIGGSASVGDRCLLGLNSIVGNKVKIGNDSVIGAGALVTRSVKEDSAVIRVNDELLEWPAREFLKLTDFDDVP
jgi:UDP-N-acetylbacillosamine N-acetyltransferase